MENKNLCSHSESCRYTEDDLMLYAYLNLFDDRYALVSANEIGLFDKYLECAKNNDKSIIIDTESNDNVSLRFVFVHIVIPLGLPP